MRSRPSERRVGRFVIAAIPTFRFRKTGYSDAFVLTRIRKRSSMGRMSEPLPAALRRERMIELIGRAGFARVSDLSEAFQVSDVTVRSDLDALDREQSIRRVHGGAVLRAAGTREPSFEEALESSAEEK